MAFIQFNNVGVAAITACVPKQVVDNYHYGLDVFTEQEVREIVGKIGVEERRFADSSVCSSDLCYAAAERLLADNSIDRSEIDLLVFVSHSADYHMPATAIVLQHRLGLPLSAMAFDVAFGCSGFLNGLSIVYAMMERQSLRKALLLVGETCSRVFSKKDRATAFIFGDGGSAALIERDVKFGSSYFSLNSDGGRGDYIMTLAGGFRNRTSAETLKEKVIDDIGNIRSDEQGFMKGMDVFSFVLEEIPRDVKQLAEVSGVDIHSLDYYLFHQANGFINGFLARKLKLDAAKIPSNIDRFGNTSSVSIPLLLTSELKEKMQGEKRLLLSAFGVGMAWATAFVPFVDCKISEMVEI